MPGSVSGGHAGKKGLEGRQPTGRSADADDGETGSGMVLHDVSLAGIFFRRGARDDDRFGFFYFYFSFFCFHGFCLFINILCIHILFPLLFNIKRGKIISK